jgi:choline kinase
MDALILAAGIGQRLQPHTVITHKSLLDVGGTSILERQIQQLNSRNIETINIVVGHYAEKIVKVVGSYANVRCIFNKEYKRANVIVSLWTALDCLRGPFVLLCGDCVFEDVILDRLLETTGNAVMVIDKQSDLDEEAMKVRINKGRIVQMGKHIPQAHGEFIGMALFRGKAVKEFKREVAVAVVNGQRYMFFGDVVHNMIQGKNVTVHYVDITGQKWCEIDYEKDLQRARRMFANQSCSLETLGLEPGFILL